MGSDPGDVGSERWSSPYETTVITGRDYTDDAAIGWLVQGILGNLFTEKLEAWTQRIGLADDVDKLKSDMRYVQMVAAAAKGRKIENEPLAQSLADLKELLYDAEDVMDDLDYYRLKEQVQSGNTRGGTGTTTACNAATSSTWSSCSIQQHGGTLIRNLSNSISVGGSRGKRKREDDHTIAACTHLNRSEFSRRIKDIRGKLRDLARDVSDALKIDGSNLPVASNLSQSTRVTSSFLVERKVYGRDAEVKSILELVARSRSSISVLAVVGMGGIGKTTLAQLVYNHPKVESHFQNKIWVCVSDNFDVRRVTREILDRVSETRLPETDNLDGLQEDLVKRMESKRFLIVLDDVWDDMKQGSWEKLLAPLKRIQTTGNMILVTTRKVSVAEMTQTVEPVKLNALEGYALWQMFISCAFGDEKYEEHPSLCTIGKQITKKLRGNPLAVKTVGALLRKNISIDNWTKILNNEEWKSLQDMEGIMPALKLSYDYLPDSLQQCFRYCCLFPKNYLFDAVKLVRMWISQGFVHGNHTGKKLEDIGNAYLADLVNSGFLVNLGFFKLVGRGRNYSNHFVMHDLMHDLAWEVSRTDFATIDGTKHKEILPTTRHLSIFTGFSADYEPKFSCDSLEKNLLQLTSVRKLRSLILIGGYDFSFFTSFQHMFKEAENLRLLQVSATDAHFDCFISSLVNCMHIRYVEVDRIGSPTGVLPHALIKFFHLEVLDVDPYVGLTLPSDMSNLVSLQHLVGAGEVLSTIASVGNVTSLQELPVFKVQKASGFDIRQLKFMNQLVQLGIYQIENVRSKQEATEARLIDKGHLEELCLLWDSDSTSLETSTETITEVLEVLKPHQNLKHLQISGYSGSVSPSWLEKFWFLRKLKLINICHVQEVRIPCLEELVLSGLPRLEKCMATCTRELDFYLRVLIIENCHELKVFTPFEIQNLCSSEVQQRSQMLSLKGTGSGFSYVEAERNKWLSGLRVLKIHGCPRLMLLHPLPPAENTQVSVQALLTYPAVERMNSNDLSVMSSKELRVLNAKVLEFQNLTDVTSLHIEHCPNLVFLSSEGLRQLLNLRKMAIVSCGNLVSSCIVPNAVSESWKATDHPAFPRLKHLRIESCGGIAGRWLTEMLPHMQSLKELDIEGCPQMKSISIHHPRQEAESSSLACQAVLPTSLGQDEFLLHIPLNVLSTLEKFRIQRCPEMQLYSSSRQGFRGFTSLTELIITGCPMLISSGNERFSVPPSVQYLCIEFLPRRLQPYFPENQSSLRFLSVRESPDLQSLRLHCCTALQEFQIQSCRQVAALEGMQYLSSLRVLSIEMNPELCASWVRRCQDVQQQSGHTRLLPPSLEKLSIRHLQDGLAPYLLAHGTFLFTLVVEDSPNLTSLQLGSLAALRNLQIQDCGSLTSLQGVLPKLEVCFCDSQNLTSLQLGALTALEDLTVYSCDWLTSLETLASLGNLADLAIYECRSIAPLLELLSRQPEGFSVFPRLERLYVDDLSALAMTFFKHLTSLRYLRVTYDSNRNSVRFTDEQEKALQLLTSLQCLAILGFLDLKELPAVLHSLHSLKRLDVRGCPRISRLPEKGLPPSLDVLEINDCSMELQEQCRMLATGKLRVQIYNYHR